MKSFLCTLFTAAITLVLSSGAQAQTQTPAKVRFTLDRVA